MKNDKNFLAAVISAVGTFVLIPASIMSIWVIFSFAEHKLSSFQVVNLILSFLVIIVFVVETIYLIGNSKEDRFGRTYNIVSIVVNSLLTIAGVLLFILMTIEMARISTSIGFVDVLEIIIGLLDGSIIAVISAISVGLKLSKILKK